LDVVAACAGIGALDVDLLLKSKDWPVPLTGVPLPPPLCLRCLSAALPRMAAAWPQDPGFQHQPGIFGLDAWDGSLCSSAADIANLSQHLRHLSVTLSSGDISGHTVQVRRHDLRTTHLCLARPAGILAFLLVGNRYVAAANALEAFRSEAFLSPYY